MNILAHLKGLENSGVVFVLRDDGKFSVIPAPERGSALQSFCRENRDAIAFELWFRRQGRPEVSLFGEIPDTLGLETMRVFPGSQEVYRTTPEELTRLFGVLCDASPEVDTFGLAGQLGCGRLALLGRIIALCEEQGQMVGRDWAIRAYVTLANEMHLENSSKMLKSA